MKGNLLITLCLIASIGYSQTPFNANKKLQTSGTSKLSTSTQFLIYKAKHNKSNSLENPTSSSLVRISLKFKEGCENAMQNQVFKNLYKYNDTFATAFVKLSELKTLEEIDCLLYADAGGDMEPQVMNAREKTNVDEVHLGFSLNHSYTGNGVIVGIIDEGFYYNHDNFKDENGNLRITRVWERTNDTGTSPTAFGFDYGSEFVGESEIISRLFDKPDASHGTHVTGIAAGTGNTSDLRGMAPDSEIVLVSGFRGTYIDGIQYLKNYAESVNKPLVVNMSFGGNLNPHDGSTPQEQEINVLSDEQGLVMVAGAGNEAEKKQHAYLEFIGEESLFLLDRNNNSPAVNQNSQTGLSLSYFDFWGENNGGDSSFEVAFQVFNTSTGEPQSPTVYSIVVNGNYETTEPIILEDIDCTNCTEDVWRIHLLTEINPLNNRPHFIVSIETNNDDLDDFLIFQVTANNTVVHSWCKFSEFYNPFPELYNFIEGDGFYSILSPANATGVIAVGSYNSTNTDPLGGYILENDLSSFSSMGPRIDFVQKPNITAPGNAIISSISSFDSNYNTDNIEISFGNNGYAKMKGTSMASPVVAGIAALWLEANPSLSTNQVMTMMQNTAINDVYTEYTWSTPNPFWGYGKVDALAGLQSIENTLSIIPSENLLNFKLYPNPTNSIINFDNSQTNFEILEIYNVLGQSLLKVHLDNSNQSNINISKFNSGVYTFKFMKQGMFKTVKVIKN